MARKVEVHPYDPAWPELYGEEAHRLCPLIAQNLISLHHIGSTAVPGLAAKPTIDILAVVRDHAGLDAQTPALESLGYQAKGENDLPGRRYFQKLEGEVHLFHIHAYQQGSPDILRHLDFRDFLRAHPKKAWDYAALKRSLAKQFPYEPKSYTEGKTDFIREVERLAAIWRMAP